MGVRSGWRARREAGLINMHAGSKFFLVGSVLAAFRGYHTYGPWYPSVMVVGAALLAWVATGYELRRRRKRPAAAPALPRRRPRWVSAVMAVGALLVGGIIVLGAVFKHDCKDADKWRQAQDDLAQEWSNLDRVVARAASGDQKVQKTEGCSGSGDDVARQVIIRGRGASVTRLHEALLHSGLYRDDGGTLRPVDGSGQKANLVIGARGDDLEVDMVLNL